MNKHLKSAAEKVTDKFRDSDAEDRQAAFDPSFILVIAQALVPLVEAVQSCLAASKVPSAARSPSLWQRIVVRNELRKSVDKKFWRGNQQELVQAVFDAAADSTVEEIKALYDSV